jgi:hypothetical protein
MPYLILGPCDRADLVSLAHEQIVQVHSYSDFLKASIIRILTCLSLIWTTRTVLLEQFFSSEIVFISGWKWNEGIGNKIYEF